MVICSGYRSKRPILRKMAELAFGRPETNSFETCAATASTHPRIRLRPYIAHRWAKTMVGRRVRPPTSQKFCAFSCGISYINRTKFPKSVKLAICRDLAEMVFRRPWTNSFETEAAGAFEPPINRICGWIWRSGAWRTGRLGGQDPRMRFIVGPQGPTYRTGRCQNELFSPQRALSSKTRP